VSITDSAREVTARHTLDEFAVMWADAMRGDPGENERGPTP